MVTFGARATSSGATVDLLWHGRRIVFTGDLGRYDDLIMFDPSRCRVPTIW